MSSRQKPLVNELPDLIIKPILQELGRTQVCFPNLKLLVDRIDVVDVNGEASDGNRAYRLLLTDREKTINAVLKRRIFKVINKGEVREGSIVILKEYKLATAKRLNGDGEVAYLAIFDLYPIGRDRNHRRKEIAQPVPTNKDQPSADIEMTDDDDNEDIQMSDDDESKSKSKVLQQRRPNSDSWMRDPAVERDIARLSRLAPEIPRLGVSDHQRRPQLPEPDCKRSHDAASSDAPHERESSKPVPLHRTSEWLEAATIEHHNRCHAQPWNQSNHNDLHKAAPSKTPICTSFSIYAQRALTSDNPLTPITRPLKLHPLSTLTGPHASRNKVVDILAIITSIDPTPTKPKPPQMPLKRDIRITDPSLPKGRDVVLSIFVDPDLYPLTDGKSLVDGDGEGAVVLFRNLVTHEYGGGKVNAYVAYCAGRDWFLPEPRCVVGVDVEGFRGRMREREREGEREGR